MTEHKRFATLTELFEYLCEEAGARVAYEAGETIYKQGQPDNRVYQVQSGGIAQSKRNRTGDVMTYQVLHPGDILSTYNLSSNVINQPCSAKALIKSELRQVLRASFKQHIRHNPDLLLKIVDLVSEELQSRDRTLERQIYMTAKERIFSILQELGKLAKENRDGKHIDFLTRRELADMAGMTEETATRSLSKLEKEGKIKKGPRGLVLTD